MTLLDSRKAVLLNGCRNIITSKLNVLEHDWVQTSILKSSNRVNADSALLSDLELGDAIQLK